MGAEDFGRCSTNRDPQKKVAKLNQFIFQIIFSECVLYFWCLVKAASQKTWEKYAF